MFYLSLCAFFNDTSVLGSFGVALARLNIFLFGKLAYIYPFLLMGLNYYCFEKDYDFKNFTKEQYLALFLLFLASLFLLCAFGEDLGLFARLLRKLFNQVFALILALLMVISCFVLLFPHLARKHLGLNLNLLLKRKEKEEEFLNPKAGIKIETKEVELNLKPRDLTNEDAEVRTFKHSKTLLALMDNISSTNEEDSMIPKKFLQATTIKAMRENLDEPSYLAKEIKEEIVVNLDEPSYLRAKRGEFEKKDLYLESKKAEEEFEKSLLSTKQDSRKSLLWERMKEPTSIEFEKSYEKDKLYEEASYVDLAFKDTSHEDENYGEELAAMVASELKNSHEGLSLEKDFKFEATSELKSQAQALSTKMNTPVPESIIKQKEDLEKLAKTLQASQNESVNLEQFNQDLEEIQKVLDDDVFKDTNLAKSPTQGYEIASSLDENKELLASLNSQSHESMPKNDSFTLPPLSFLKDPGDNLVEIDEEAIDRQIYELLEKLRRFKIGGDVIRTYTGPVVTTFEFRPTADVKVSKILGLQDDLAMALKAQTIRIQAPIPGKDVVGIEVPNEHIQTIYLREILESELFKNASSPLTIALGKDIVGKPFITDLAKLPHLLIAGTTGSGKSVGINAMLLSLLYKNSPKSLRLMMIDPKMLEFSIYNDIPHLLTPVITDPKKAIIALSNMVAEMERRYRLLASAKKKNIQNYNDSLADESERLPYIVVIIDELADLIMTGGKDVEFYIARLAQMARASGIHLLVATQRPSTDVVTGMIKANLPSRLAYKVGQKIDSKVILDAMGADSLLGRGDCLFTPPGQSTLVRLHAPYASEEEIEKIVDFLKSQGEAEYDESFLEGASSAPASGGGVIGEVDDLFEEAKAVIKQDGKASISYIQRRLGIGYNKAANIIEQLTQDGFLGEPSSTGKREILG